MAQIYWLIFWIPAAASAVFLLFGLASGWFRRPLIQILWFAIALLLQVRSGLFSPMWAVGLGLQVVLALSLAIRSKLE